MNADRRIDLPPFPRGWFVVGLSHELALGDVRPVRYFGEELVLFRTESGEPVLLEGYCPHLGAHFGHGGTVAGEILTCPFHGWRFGTDGRCVGMPYGDRIPSGARARRWSVREQNEVIVAWNDPAGSAPDWEMRLFDDAQWTAARTQRWVIHGHPQEVMENTVDGGHFRFVHGSHPMFPTEEPTIEGPFFDTHIESVPDALEPELGIEAPVLEGAACAWGPGLTFATIAPKGSGLDACQRLYVTPVDDERIELFGMLNVGRQETDDATVALLDALAPEVMRQWELDIPIWEHKRYRDKPALNAMETGITKFRRWYRQFYA